MAHAAGRSGPGHGAYSTPDPCALAVHPWHSNARPMGSYVFRSGGHGILALWQLPLQDVAANAEKMHQHLAVASPEDAMAYMALLKEHSHRTWDTAEVMRAVGAHERAVRSGDAPRLPLPSRTRSSRGRRYDVDEAPADGMWLSPCGWWLLLHLALFILSRSWCSGLFLLARFRRGVSPDSTKSHVQGKPCMWPLCTLYLSLSPLPCFKMRLAHCCRALGQLR